MWRAGTILLLAALATSVGCGADAEPRAAAPAAAATPRHFAPTGVATATATPAAPPAGGRHLVAAVRRHTLLRSRPGGPVVARVARRTQWGSPTALGVVGQRAGWVRVLHPALDNGRTGWIPAAGVELQATDYAIRIDRSAREARLLDGDRTVMRFAVAVGRAGNETPLGRFAVTDKLRPADPASPYGCCAVALTGHQPKLVPGWPGGDRLAIHGTPAADSIGRAASLGCLRAGRRPMVRLMRQLPLGTPVIVRA